jgi:PAS domain S-box-containing protein
VGGLPVYSASGFDLLSILARVATRPHPKIVLGPVDLTCSFVVVDVRRFDHPIVYASPTFCKLTGYTEEEIIGHNCRFLQAPGGQVQKGDTRRHTAQDAVAHMRKSLVADKECQVSLVNYRKDGSAFINLVTVIPIPGGVHNAPHEAEDVVYQVGFQVDLTEQPNAILQKLRDGSYMVNYANNMSYPPATQKDTKTNAPTITGVSKQFRNALNNQDFVSSIPIHASTTTLSIAPDEKNDPYDGNRLLSLIMLQTSPDFIVVLSLKGAFLYVSPSVTRTLGYEPEELVGKGITDFCHEADKVPLIRELKESSILLPGHTTTADKSQQPPQKEKEKDDSSDKPEQQASGSATRSPRSVDLLFRMQVKDSSFVWVECSGKLFVEPGKGRKAIILSGRVRNVPSLKWEAVGHAGGLAEQDTPFSAHSVRSPTDTAAHERECWALLSVGGSILHAGTGVRDVLGWGVAEVIGRPVDDFVAAHDRAHGRAIVQETLQQAFADASMESRSLSCHLQRKDGTSVLAELTFYHPAPDSLDPGRTSRPLVCQIRLAQNAQTDAPSTMVHPPTEDVFAELDTARESGWQYELQQLKYANQKLLEEVEELETKLELRQSPYRREASRANDSAWASQLMSVSTSLKRAWDGTPVNNSS